MGLVRETKQSKLILDIINNSKDHLSAHSIYEEARKIIPNISLGTVYRDITHLVEDGCVIKITGADSSYHYDNTLNKHHHFICRECNHIYDILDKIKIPMDISCGHVSSYEIYYNGICNKCLEKEKKHGTKR